MEDSNLRYVGITYRQLPIDLREQFFLNNTDTVEILQYLKENLVIKELFVLSTCHRTEIYYQSEQNLSNFFIKILLSKKLKKFSEKDISLYQPYFKQIEDTTEVARHLFCVAMGLESMVLGEPQIYNQIKNAYTTSCENNTAGPVLHRLMHTIFHTHKLIYEQTSFYQGVTSICKIATGLAELMTAGRKENNIMVIGTGEIGKDCILDLLGSTKFQKIYIANQSADSIQRIIGSVSSKDNNRLIPLPLSAVWEYISEVQVIISAISTVKPFIQYPILKKYEYFEHKYFIDLSVPRSIDEQIEKLDWVVLYNLDELKYHSEINIENRKNQIPLVKKLIEQELGHFISWTKEKDYSKILVEIRSSLEKIRQKEINQWVSDLNEKDLEKINFITNGIVNDILKLPALQFKNCCKQEEAENLTKVLKDLFQIESVQEKESQP